MKFPSGEYSQPQYAIDPVRFRAQATGVGQTQSMSYSTGRMRAQRVIDSVPAESRGKIPAAEGYPEPTPAMDMSVNGRRY